MNKLTDQIQAEVNKVVLGKEDIVRKVLTRFRMPYLTVTPLFSVCDKHGYLRGEHQYCPFCDEELLHIHRHE